MAHYTRKYLPNDKCPEAPEEIRGQLHATAPQALKDLRIAWIKARIAEGYTQKTIGDRLDINQSSTSDLIKLHDLASERTVAGSYIIHKMGLRQGTFRNAFNNAPQYVQSAIIDKALQDKSPILTAAFALLAEALKE